MSSAYGVSLLRASGKAPGFYLVMDVHVMSIKVVTSCKSVSVAAKISL